MIARMRADGYNASYPAVYFARFRGEASIQPARKMRSGDVESFA